MYGPLRFDVDFTPHPFEKGRIEELKEDIRSRLAGLELGQLRIVLRKRLGSHEITPHLMGDPVAVEQGQRVLGIY